MTALDRCRNIHDLRCLARKRLPYPMWEFLEGGSDDEWSLRNNGHAFNRYSLIPRALEILTEEICRDMTLLGITQLAQLDSSFIRRERT